MRNGEQFNFGDLERAAWKRANNQKKISLFGDDDKDGVKNILDCRPLNFKKQGIAHRVKNLITGKGFVENDTAQENKELKQIQKDVQVEARREALQSDEYKQYLRQEALRKQQQPPQRWQQLQKIAQHVQPRLKTISQKAATSFQPVNTNSSKVLNNCICGNNNNNNMSTIDKFKLKAKNIKSKI